MTNIKMILNLYKNGVTVYLEISVGKEDTSLAVLTFILEFSSSWSDVSIYCHLTTPYRAGDIITIKEYNI